MRDPVSTGEGAVANYLCNIVLLTRGNHAALPDRYKASAARLALEIRAEFDVASEDPFDPYEFASEYGIPVVGLGDLDGAARDHFYYSPDAALSGALIKSGNGFVILITTLIRPRDDAPLCLTRSLTFCWSMSSRAF